MRTTKSARRYRFSRALMAILALVALVALACGSPTAEEQQTTTAATQPDTARPEALAIPATQAPAPQAPAQEPAMSGSQEPASQPASEAPAPTAAPQPTPAPAAAAEPGRDTMIFLTAEEPTTVGAASANCGGNIQNTICDDLASDPFTWIDDHNDYRVVGLTGVEGWEQIGDDRWQFRLREGVTFHNGAPWNAEQAKFWIDFFGDEETSGHYNSNDFSFHGVISGEVVDEYTLDVVCGKACPILPRTTIFTKFQDTGWFLEVTGASSYADLPEEMPDEVERLTVGLGPYKIVEWDTGLEITLEAHEGYNPNPATNYSRAPSIPNLVQQWRNEPLVRAAALSAGEADWAEIAFQDRELAPQWKSATNNEAYVYAVDTVHHPWLRMKEVREALNLAIDCETLMAEIFDGVLECYGNIAQTGTVGITPENSAGYPYDPERAMQLLQEVGYDKDADDSLIKLHIRSQRVPKDVEYAEAVVTFWRDVGVNAELLVVESSIHAGTGRSNCGHGRTREDFDNAPGADLHEKCLALGPGMPNFASMHITAPATSTESLDFSRQAVLRNSCYSRSSGVCFQDFEDKLEIANATPSGELRRERMEELADQVHFNYHFVPNFLVVQIYGLSADLEWEPHYAPRIRANIMDFTN
ncbi:MAG: ABC transporter substrate-binding protein [Chloroflexota bacterium]|nr:ABC transporter substrate-binding protein [Chloroflexota bacterium]